jgi:hypothetical protein
MSTMIMMRMMIMMIMMMIIIMIMLVMIIIIIVIMTIFADALMSTHPTLSPRTLSTPPSAPHRASTQPSPHLPLLHDDLPGGHLRADTRPPPNNGVTWRSLTSPPG